MPHVALVPFTGFRIREAELLALGMSLPGLHARGQAIAQLPALGLLTLAGLNPPGWTCSYHEADGNLDELADRVAAKKPALVAISALTASIDEAYRFAGLLRRRGLRSTIGGLHATACPNEVRRHCDAVVVGDGEPAWPRLLADAEAGALQPIYKFSPYDLARSSTPRFDLLRERPRPRFTVQTQRGCPFACEFCGASRLLGPHRLKPIANIRGELAALPARPIVELADDNTFAGGREAEPLLDALADADARWFTEVDWRIGEQPRLLERLAASGCVQVLVGLESLVFRYPGMGPKNAEMPRVLSALGAIQDAGVAVLGCFIVGGDGETRQSLDRMADFIDKTSLADIQLTMQTPFPGTELHRRLQREGRLLPDRGWSAYTLFDVTYQPDLMTVAELETGFRELIQRVHAPAQAARRHALRKQIWRRNPRLRPCESTSCPVT